MPDVGVSHLEFQPHRLLDTSDSWSMDISRGYDPPPAPVLKNKRELISCGRRGNGGITTLVGYKGFVVNIHPPKWKDLNLSIKTEDHRAAQFVADAMLYYVGRPPVHFPEADFRYPSLSLNTGEYLTTREKCSAYVAKIAKDPALGFKRREYKDCVQRLVLGAVKSPEVVHFLNCMRGNSGQGSQFDAEMVSECGKLIPENAYSELETYSTRTVNVEEERWKSLGLSVKEATTLPLVKQCFRDDHDHDVSLKTSFSSEEDDKKGVDLSIFSIPSSASPSTRATSLIEAASSGRSQKKKTLLLEWLSIECDQFLYPSPEAEFATQVEAADMMLVVQDLLAHEPGPDETIELLHSIPEPGPVGTPEIDLLQAIPELGSVGTPEIDLLQAIPEPGPEGTPEIKQPVKHPVVADLPSSADCLEETGDEPDSESEVTDILTDEEVSSGESEASVESHTEIASADSHGPQTESSRKRSAASAFYDDNLFAQIRSYVNQQIEEALLPLMNALRSREEDEHKHRQKMLAFEREKLALMRQKL